MSNVSSSNSQGVRVPKLRFPGFEGEWKEIFLSEFSQFLPGLTYKPEDVKTDGKLVLRSSNIQNSQLDFNDNVYVDSSIVPDRIRTRSNDVLMCVRNGSKSLVGKTALISDEHSDLAWGAFMTVLRPNTNNTLLYHYLNSPSFRKQVFPDLETATVKQITMSTLNRIKLLVPNTDEQDKISDFLSALDKRIEKQRQLVEALKSYKRGLSEALFSGKIGRWDLSNIPCGKYKLGELGYFYNGLSGKNKNDFGKGTSQYISYMNVYKNLIADEHILENVIVSATEKQNSVKYGDVLFTQSSETLNEVGYTSVWLSKSTPFLNSFCFGFRFYEQEQTDPYFIAHYFRSSTIRKSIMREGQGATRVNLSSERLKDMVILLPPVHIQKEIGKILNHLEQQIEINAHIEIQLSIYKSRLLQQLFI